VLDCGEKVVLHPHKESTLLPGVLQVERLEVVPEAPLAVADDGDEAKVLQLVVLVDGPSSS